jgi:hypothetical protein
VVYREAVITHLRAPLYKREAHVCMLGAAPVHLCAATVEGEARPVHVCPSPVVSQAWPARVGTLVIANSANRRVAQSTAIKGGGVVGSSPAIITVLSL